MANGSTYESDGANESSISAAEPMIARTSSLTAALGSANHDLDQGEAACRLDGLVAHEQRQGSPVAGSAGAASGKAQGDEIQQTQEAIEDTEVTVWLYG